MSNCYLCDTCAHGHASQGGMWVWRYCDERSAYMDAIPVMHDGIERPTDLCECYETNEDGGHERTRRQA